MEFSVALIERLSAALLSYPKTAQQNVRAQAQARLWKFPKASFRFLAFFPSLIVLFGCYVSPLGDQITRSDLDSITVGADRSEIRKLLGEGVLLDHGRFLVADVSWNRGLILMAGPGGIGGIVLGGERYRVLVEFDKNDTVRRHEIEAGTEPVTGSRASVTPIGQGEKSACIQLRKILPIERGFGAFSGSSQLLTSVTFSPDDALLAAGTSGGVFGYDHLWLWNLVSGEEPTRTDFDEFSALKFSQDGERLALVGRTVKIIDVKTRQLVLKFDGHGDSTFWSSRGVTSFALAHSGEVAATGGYQGAVKLWKLSSGDVFLTINAHQGIVGSLTFSPDGKMLATSGSDNKVTLWDASTGTELQTLEGWAGLVAFSPSGSMISIHRGGFIELWRITDDKSRGEPVSELLDVFLLPYFGTSLWRKGSSLIFFPDGKTLAASAGGAVMWSIETSQKLWRFVPKGDGTYSDAINAMSVAADGLTLATATNRDIRLGKLQF